ncbi:NAD-dependent epimerase/dehydratase [Candidatus Sulfopaludibacter sp. SbA3]|nr:NAD-dependent epimerase/dehydratase [Candidatus Sulfopaludibacter sp. SbA3]
MEAETQKVALFGAAGAVGHTVAAELARRGIPFRVVGRNRARLEQEFGGLPQVEVLDADLSDLRAAGAASRGVDTIIYTVGLPYPSHHLFPALMRTALEAAATMQVKRLVLISNVYSYGVPRASRVPETHPRIPATRKGAYRREQEDLVLDAHQKGKLAGLVVRMPDFYGPYADLSLANPIFRAALAGKTANWVGPDNTPHEFIFMPDAGPVVVELATRPDCFGEAWNLGGAGEINTMDFITRVYRAVGRSPKYRAVGRGMLKFLGYFNPVMREVVEMLYLQETPVILDDSKLAAKLGAIRKTSYDEGIQKTLEWMRSGKVTP